MDKKKLEGKKEEVVGHVKEGAGGLTGNRDLEAEGQDEQAKAKVSKGLGDVREGAKDLLDKAKDKLDDIDRR